MKLNSALVINKQFKIWPILRDVIIVTVLSSLGGFIVGFASTSGHNSPLYIYSLALSNSLFLTIGFTISGCLAVENRWRHLAFVGAIVWVVSIFNVVFFGLTFIQWAASVVAIAIFALIGGGISLLFKRKTLVEISSNANDEKFYEEVARELQEKSMVAGLWTKAFAEMGGDEAKARALYIKYRVAQLAAASRQQLPEEQNKSKNTQVIFVAVIFAAVVLAAIFGVMTSNKNGKVNASTVTQTEQLPAVQTPAESEFERQKQLAEKGDVKAQEYMGLCYSVAAGQEVHLGTNSNLANQYYVKAIEWYRMAADQGSAQGQFFLGYCYSGGKGVAQDFSEAIRWYRKSTDQNYAAAQKSLGDCYFLGQGVTKDEVEAVKWYLKAAEQGDFFSQDKLGAIYANGYGVETNLVQAAKWYSLAAFCFNSSKTNLALIESQMTPEQIAEAQKLSAAFVPRKQK
jgi:TPR repeat protein